MLAISSTTKILIIGGIAWCVLSILLIWKRDSWRRHTLPREYLLIEPEEELKRVLKRSLWLYIKDRNSWMRFTVYIIVVILLQVALKALAVSAAQGSPRDVLTAKVLLVIYVAIPVCAGVYLAMTWQHKWLEVYLRQHLNEHGIPICMNCGYDLRGQVNRVCPECGTERGTESGKT